MEYKLRPFRQGDLEALLRYANNKKIADNLRDGFPHPYTKKAALDFLADCAGPEDRSCIRAVEVDGEAVGSIGVFCGENEYRKSAELGYWLAEPFWGRGLMSRVIREFSLEAFPRYALLRIYAQPYAHNAGSRRALEKAGYTLEGVLRQHLIKNGAVVDSCVYSLLRDELNG